MRQYRIWSCGQRRMGDGRRDEGRLTRRPMAWVWPKAKRDESETAMAAAMRWLCGLSPGRQLWSGEERLVGRQVGN